MLSLGEVLILVVLIGVLNLILGFALGTLFSRRSE